MSKSHEPLDSREVRITAKMTLAERNRIRILAIRAGEPLERMATRWLLERADTEESKAADAKRKKG